MIKTKSLLLGMLTTGLLTWAGCNQAKPPPPPGAMQVLGVNVDLPKLEQEFQNASPELQAAVQEIKRYCRTLQLVKMGVALENLGNNPSLTETQKKTVSDVFGQVDRVLAKQAALHGR